MFNRISSTVSSSSSSSSSPPSSFSFLLFSLLLDGEQSRNSLGDCVDDCSDNRRRSVAKRASTVEMYRHVFFLLFLFIGISLAVWGLHSLSLSRCTYTVGFAPAMYSAQQGTRFHFSFNFLFGLSFFSLLFL